MWFAIASLVLNLVFSAFLRPSPPPGPSPAGLGDLDVPTANEGSSIPVIFGRRHIKSPNVVWYGHLRTTAIKTSSGKK